MQAYTTKKIEPQCDEDATWDNPLAALFAQQQQRSALKQQLTAQTKAQPIGAQLSSLTYDTTEAILTSSPQALTTLEPKLLALFDAYRHVYETADITKAERTQQFISQHGLVMAPNYCIHTIKDTLRVSGFIRAIKKAIDTLFECGQEKVFIAYPACGPFAPLLVPLLSYYQRQGVSGERLRVTFIDMQPGAIKALHTLITELNLKEYVHQLYCGDACEYNAPMLFDMVILEAMQHGFSREGHLAIARQFATQLSTHGYFIPQQINVHAMLSVAQQEYVEQWRNQGLDEQAIAAKREEIAAQRTELGVVMSLNSKTLTQITTEQVAKQSLVNAGKVTIPHLHHQVAKQVLSLYTHISLFADEQLAIYDSGITQPLPDLTVCINFTPADPQPDDTLACSGDTLSFYYSLSGLPGFLVTKDYSNEK